MPSAMFHTGDPTMAPYPLRPDAHIVLGTQDGGALFAFLAR